MRTSSAQRVLYDSEAALRLITGVLDELHTGVPGGRLNRGLEMLQLPLRGECEGVSFADPELAWLAAGAVEGQDMPEPHDGAESLSVLSRLHRALTLVDQLDLTPEDAQHRRRLICSGLRDEILETIDALRASETTGSV